MLASYPVHHRTTPINSSHLSEATHHSPEDCTSDQFFCDDECHSRSIVCNGYDDCVDRSDEQNCPPTYPTYPTRRPPTYPCPQHTCSNGKCYSEAEKCDGSLDCDDGADEENCKLLTIKKKFQKSIYGEKHKNMPKMYYKNIVRGTGKAVIFLR